MASSCLMAQFLSSQCGLQMRQYSRMVLATHLAVWGEKPLYCWV